MRSSQFSPTLWFTLICFFGMWLTSLAGVYGQPSVANVVAASQNKVVKIYGAGGAGGLDAYQSGFLVSPYGHVATVWSTVLDVTPVVVLSDGRRFEGDIVGFEPALEMAVLKIDVGELPFFEVRDADSFSERDVSDTTMKRPRWGDPVLAVSNLFNIAQGNEPPSAMQGRIAAQSKLDARRGTFQTAYRGEVFLLDLVANNPGAAGGALINMRGDLIGMLGKELRDRKTGVWLNYAIPSFVLRESIGDIIAGKKTVAVVSEDPLLSREKSHSLETLGLGLIPDVLEVTPVFVDHVASRSPAGQADLRPDDLILLVNGVRAPHQRVFREQLRRIDRRDNVVLIIQRENEILEVVLRP